MKKSHGYVAALGAVLALSGCVTTAPGQARCDVHNRNASLGEKMECRQAYAETESRAQRNLEIAREENRVVREALDALNDEQYAVGKRLQEREAARRNADAALHTMLRKVKARKALSQDTQRQVADIEKMLQAQSQQPSASSQAALKKREKERDALRHKVEQLQKSLDY